jgi:hypothetical protein
LGGYGKRIHLPFKEKTMKIQITFATCFGLLVAAMLLVSSSPAALGTPVPQNKFRTRLVPTKSKPKLTTKSGVKTRTQPTAQGRGKSTSSANLNFGKKTAPTRRTVAPKPTPQRFENFRRVPSTPRSQSNNATAQSVPNSQSDTFSQAEVAEFVQLHADHLSEILERRNEFYEKLTEAQQLVQQISGSPYVSLRRQMFFKVAGLKQSVGTYGAYSITTPQQIKLTIPNEQRIDNLINDLEDLVDQMKDRADDRDEDYAKDLAEQLDDLVDDADRLEGRLTRKTNRLKRIWSHRGGDVDNF